MPCPPTQGCNTLRAAWKHLSDSWSGCSGWTAARSTWTDAAPDLQKEAGHGEERWGISMGAEGTFRCAVPR
jgi:hypothetical protein